MCNISKGIPQCPYERDDKHDPDEGDYCALEINHDGHHATDYDAAQGKVSANKDWYLSYESKLELEVDNLTLRLTTFQEEHAELINALEDLCGIVCEDAEVNKVGTDAWVAHNIANQVLNKINNRIVSETK